MSEPLNTFFAYFDTYNFTNTPAISSYTLPFCNLVFKLRSTEISGVLSNSRIVWDFGDGTTVEAITAKHAYNIPGTYKVSCYLYNSAGESFYNTFSQQVQIYDFISTKINIIEPLNVYTLTASQINTPINLHNYISWQGKTPDTQTTIIPFCSGADNNFFNSEIISRRYNYLYPYSSFYSLITSNGNTEFVEISSITPNYTPLYCKLSSNSVVYTTKEDSTGVFCGLSGESTVYYKDDVARNRINLLFGYDSSAIYNATNTSTVGLSGSIISNPNVAELYINSSGITSEGLTTEVFPICKNKFNGTQISFVCKVKDIDNFTNKNININTSLSSTSIPSTYKLKFKLIADGSPVNNAVFYSDNSIMPYLCGGIFKGYVVTDIPTTYNAYISAILVDGSLPTTVSGISNQFDIYAVNHFTIAKHGEDIDFTAKFKDLAFQPLFTDTPVLFDEFLNSIFGNISSLPTEQVGKRTYEKITNFVDNTSSLDYSNVENLIGLCQQYGVDISNYGKSNYLYPSDIRRLVDLLSINFSRLRGGQDLTGINFDTKGYIDNELYGSNKGSQLSLNYVITAGTDIVSYEKYSGVYKRHNTFLPLCASNVTLLTNNTYSLSSYNNTWGWGLILPDTYPTIDYYYEFFSYIPSITGEQVGGILNYSDVINTLSYNLSSYDDWSKEEGVISNILANQLYVGLDLFNK